MRVFALAAILVAILTAPAAAQTPLLEVEGRFAAERMQSVVGVGDVTGDGVGELLTSSAGRDVRLVDGSTGQFLLYLPPSHGASGNGFGLADAGDFDGDGMPDFVVGEAQYSLGPYDAGRVTVYSGVTLSPIAEVYGTSQSQKLGREVAGIGDVTGDGLDDLLVGGFYDEVWVLRGPDAAVVRVHTNVGTRPAVDGVGDVNGDGVADYVVGWPQDSTAGLWTGRATVFSGATGAEIHTVYGAQAHVHSPELTGDHLGRSVAGLGDVDGDGVPDFAAGMPAEIDYLFTTYRDGAARVYSGATGQLLLELEDSDEEISGDYFGYRLAGGGDLNGDGFGDVLVSAPHHYEGVGTGAITVFSGREGTLLWRFMDPGHPLFRFGVWPFDIVPDRNGDGLAEFAVGNPEANGVMGTDTGHVLVLAGAPGGATRYCPAAVNSAGLAARIDLDGPISVGNDALLLLGENLPAGQFGVFFYGPEMASMPFGDGTRCVGAGSIGLFRVPPVVQADAQGEVASPLSFSQPPAGGGPGAIAPGTTWSMQLWYRDPTGGPSGFNTSDALRVLFTP